MSSQPQIMPTRRYARFLALLLLSFVFALAGTHVSAAPKDRLAPTAPMSLTALNVTSSNLQLSWKPSTDNVGIAKYLVYRGTVQIGSATTTAYVVNNLLAGTKYSFIVKAADAAGNVSAASATLTVTTAVAATTTTTVSTDAAATTTTTGTAIETTTSAAPTATTTASPSVAATGKRVVGYYTGWSTYNGLQIASIDGSKLTHINYAFANVGADLKVVPSDPYADIQKRFPNELTTDPFYGNFNQLLKLKQKYPHLKTLISVGGWGGSAQFSNAALNETNREIFAASAVQFIVQYGFDGIDIDWEYPVAGGAAGNINRPEDKTNFTLLMQKLREKLNAQSLKDGKTYLLTFASAVGGSYLNNVEIAKLAAISDYINLMSYDIHGTWETMTGFNAPLYRDPASKFTWETSVSDAIALYLKAAVPADKIVMGIPFYGTKYTNVASAGSGLYQTYSGGGSVTYADLKSSFIGLNGYTRYFNADSKVPYLWNGSTFISYDDAESIGHKAAYIKSQNLAGAMIWSLGYDTTNGELLGALHQSLQ
ncbi:glycosyl hydrolase family 18 protein [Paenibacillus methanolicus]|uniref:chitinase n=1 Tax=Paenibacillus methanolicus TaxID=582686 RepID=A0A5S5C3F8_9BACL|nr:glycosyl hydrolase family 18 protein [Paenibacillus methanolicus]TYP73965.1 chitinase [Paenibacillus methanolicus]